MAAATAWTLIVAGEHGNLLTRATILDHSAEDPLFPFAGFVDQRQESPGRWAAAVEDGPLGYDLCLLRYQAGDGGFEGSTLAWTSDCVGASNTAALDSAQHNTGAKSLKLHLATAGAGNRASGYRDMTNVPAGMTGSLSVALRGDGTIPVAFQVYLPQVGLWLQSDGSWGTEAYVWTRTTASWNTPTTLAVTLPGYATTRRQHVTVRLIAILEHATTAGDGWLDDVTFHPHWDFFSAHDHDLGPIDIELYESDDASTWALVDTCDIEPRSFFWYSTTKRTKRYVRILVAGTNHEPAWFGELWLAQALAVAESPSINVGRADALPQIRSTPGHGLGTASVSALADTPQRTLLFDWIWSTEAAWAEFLTDVMERSGYGQWPTVIVPHSDDPDVLMVHFPEELAQAWLRGVMRKTSSQLELIEDSFTIWIP